MSFPNLAVKYNVPVPRYTSYPTVPNWKENLDVPNYKSIFRKRFNIENNANGISIYIHLPFCESLCTYCGCNKKITTNHGVEHEYMNAIIKEWKLYLSQMSSKPVIKELHLGGGTPTFFSPQHLEQMLSAIFSDAIIHPDRAFSFEGHPNNTRKEHLQTLYDLGFRRLSLGVQDNDPEVQRIINRIQPLENVRNVTEWARAIGYTSVNYDLIYGLPRQTVETIAKTITEVIALRPDRIAFYSYAHVPWNSKGQRLFDENDLLPPNEKLKLYQTGKELFLANGYNDIGMDHFSLPADELYIASAQGKLHRNFMGYTTQNTSMLIGLGVSSISCTGNSFAQNAKTIHDYYAYLAQNELPIEKGYFLTDEDMRFGQYILDLSCRGITTIHPTDRDTVATYCLPELKRLWTDGLLILNGNTIQITAIGRNFIRNVCAALDLYLHKSKLAIEKKVFSSAI